MTLDVSARPRVVSWLSLIHLFSLGTARAIALFSEAAAIAPRRTPQPTSSERPKAQETRAGQSPLFVSSVCRSRSCRIFG